MKIKGVRHSSSTFSVDKLEQIIYIVLSHQLLTVETSGGDTNAVIMSLVQNSKLASTPGSDVLLCFAPVSGMASNRGGIIPSILFWGEKFWTPFLETTPSRNDIARELQLDKAEFESLEHPLGNVDMIYEIDAVDIPDLDWGSFNY